MRRQQGTKAAEGRRRESARVPEEIELWRAFSAWKYEDRRVKHHAKGREEQRGDKNLLGSWLIVRL
jgi:hypothetical protein